MKLEFNHSPNIDTISLAFPKSPYFSEEALSYRDFSEPKVGILTVSVENHVVGVLTWSISETRQELRIGQIEVLPDFRGNHIGRTLIGEIENFHSGQIESSIGYVNKRENMASVKMFLGAGYKSYDTLRYGKILRK